MKRVFVYEYLSGGGLADDPEGAHELLAMGLAMRDAVAADLLRHDRHAVTVATANADAPVPEGALAVWPDAGETATAFVASQAARHTLSWIVAPESDGVLLQLCRAVPAARWMGCSAEAIAPASSKRATLARLAAHGIATPLRFEASDDTTRWVVKPDDGAGAVATRLHPRRDAADADFAERHAAGRSAALEPWVEGEAMSLSLLCGTAGAKALSLNRQHLRLAGDGALSFDGVTVHVAPPGDARWPALRALATQVNAALPGLRGFVGIDLVWHAVHGPVVIEVNPRVTCAYVGLSQALGRNLAAEITAGHDESVAPADAAPAEAAAHG